MSGNARWVVGLLALMISGASTVTPALAQDDEPTRVLFTNVSVFDGR